MRLVIPSAVAIILAFQIAYGAFFISVLEIRASRPEPQITSSPPAPATRALDPSRPGHTRPLM